MTDSARNQPRRAASYLEEVQRVYGDPQVAPPALPTGFAFLDQSMGGWRAGLHLVAGEPGCGKSALALCTAQAVAAAGYPVLYLGFEVQPQQLVLRMLCQQFGWDRRQAVEGAIPADEMTRAIGDANQTLSRINLVAADPLLETEAVEQMARALMEEQQKRHCLIVIDYLQVWAAGKREFHEFRHEIAKLTTALRRLALDLESPVVAISSQNRAGQGEPALTSLEGTSDLEYSADSVCFLIHVERSSNQRGYLTPEETMRKSRTVSLNLRKNQFGEVGSRVVKFLPQSGAFDEEALARPGTGTY